MRLVGEDWNALSLCEQLDVVEAVFAEGVAVDANLDGLEKAIRKAYPSREDWTTSPEAQAGLAAAEQKFERAPELTPEQRAAREARKAARAAKAAAAAQVEPPSIPEQ